MDDKSDRQPSLLELLQSQPPYDLEAEIGVIGSVLLLPQIADEVAQLRPEDFYDDANRIVYSALREMHDTGSAIDITLLLSRLRSTGNLSKVGGVAHLARIGESVANASHAKYYAEIVAEKSILRRLIKSGTDIVADAYMDRGPDDTTARERCAQAEQKVFSILDGRASESVDEFGTVIHQSLDRMDARMRGDITDGAVETGFVDFDERTGGMHNGELIILAARPSMGKTALATNIAEHVSITLRKPALFVSLEMSGIEMADRMLCSVARVNGHRLRNGTISNDDHRRLLEKANEIHDAPLVVDSSASRTVGEIAAVARRIKRKQSELGLIVIDYLQLLDPDNPRDPRQEQVAKMARRLKSLAREMNVPILCLSQLNRQAEESKDHKPKLSHLRESGAIEQDADVVMFVHREEYFHRGDERAALAGQAQIIIAKQRNGPIGEIDLVWESDFTRFSNAAMQRHSEFDDYNDTQSPYQF